MNDLLSHATVQLNLKVIIPTKKSQVKRNYVLYDYTYIHLWKMQANLEGWEGDQWLPGYGVGGGGGGELQGSTSQHLGMMGIILTVMMASQVYA